jgi:hypothetical protein
MSSHRSWKVRYEDNTIEEFIDIRRKIGNRILRAYLLDPILDSTEVKSTKASLRGPKDEFKDFDKFLILKAQLEEKEFRILIEAGVYENLRVVGTDSDFVADKSPDELERIFTDALKNFKKWNTSILVGSGSKLLTR